MEVPHIFFSFISQLSSRCQSGIILRFENLRQLDCQQKAFNKGCIVCRDIT